jgi:hypothetical protein
MRNIADLLMRFWQGSQPASNTQVTAMAENRDRSSMADLSGSCRPTIKPGRARVRGDPRQSVIRTSEQTKAKS